MAIMPHLVDSDEWTIETILKSLECGTCMDEVYNHWYVCFRRSSSLNLHPEYVARSRQYWFVAIVPLKYLVLPENYTGFIFKFNGHLTPKIRSFITPNRPKHLRETKFISYGEFYYQFHLLRKDYLS